MSRRTQLHLIGNGEHARVVAEAARAGGWTLAGCWAPEVGGLGPHLGTDDDFPSERHKHLQAVFHCALVGAPDDRRRRAVLARWCGYGVTFAAVIHPAAVVASDVAVAPGAYIGPGAIVNAGAEIGAHAVVNSGAIVEHDVSIGPGAHLAPGTVIGGGTRIGAHTWCGLGCRIRDHLSIGDAAVVAMGAVVVRDIEAGVTVLGVPARIRGES